MKRVLAIGECMIELTHRSADLLALRCAGDTFNTAAYLARITGADQVHVDYLTRVGDDHYSERVLEAIRAEGVGTELVRRIPGRSPGLYLVRTDGTGERSFTYYRSQSPARELFADEVPDLSGHDVVYLSGITLQIISPAARERLWSALRAFRDGGGTVAFDSNYRPVGWSSVDEARHAMRTTWELTSLALPTFADEQALFGDTDPQTTARRLHELGAAEMAVKNGSHGCVLWQGESPLPIEALPVERVVDSTAAGDAFNAGYLAARLTGADPVDAVARAQTLAATVIQHPGAIVDRSVVPGR